MSYGITSKSQLIDINTIKAGCEMYINALDDFEKSGEDVVLAAEKCDKNALSVDDTTFQYSINDIGIELKSVKQTLTGYANQVLTDAINVYNQQVNEYNEYLRNQQKKNNG